MFNLKYLEENYNKKNDKKTPFVGEINYTGVKLDGEISANSMKHLIFMVISLEEAKLTEEIREFIDSLDRESFKNLVKEIFNKWVENGAPPKFKNILILVGYIGDISLIAAVRERMIYWSENSKPSMISYAAEALIYGGKKEALTMLEDMFQKSKNKSIRRCLGTILQEAPQMLNLTQEEYEDLLVADFGFGKDRVKEYSYGKRNIKLMLNSELKIVILDESGKVLKSLPRYSEKLGDREELVESVKEEVKALKKQLENMVTQQTRKLFIATFTMRTWTKEKWIELFVENPIMNIFATKLIWEEVDESGEVLKTFRYMEDGSFNNIDEEECELGRESNIRLLHPVEISNDELETWKEQLQDYEITQPFEQLELYIPELTPEEKSSYEYRVFGGVEFYGGTFLNVMTKMGFTLEFEDGWHVNTAHFYHKNLGDMSLYITVDLEKGDYITPIKIAEFSFDTPLGEVNSRFISFAYHVGKMLTKS